MSETKHEELLSFFKTLFEKSVMEGYGIDGDEVQDEMERLGLIKLVKIPEKNRQAYPACDEYDTDELFFPWYAKEVKGEFDEDAYE